MENNNWKPSNEDEEAWNQVFADEIDRDRWRTNFGKDSESAEHAAYWRDLVPGVEPSVAAVYHKQGLNPYDVQDYLQSGVQDYQEVLGWHRVKATPEVAAAFRGRGVNPETYEKWAALGVQDPDTMLRYSEDMKIDLKDMERFVKPLLANDNFQISDLPKWLEAGIELREIGDWLNQNFKYPSFVKAWKTLKMKPADAKKWEETVLYPREAAKWIAAGYDKVEDVASLRKLGYSSPDDIEAEAENLVVKGM